MSVTKKVHCTAHDWGQLTYLTLKCLFYSLQVVLFLLFLSVFPVVSNQDGAFLRLRLLWSQQNYFYYNVSDMQCNIMTGLNFSQGC